MNVNIIDYNDLRIKHQIGKGGQGIVELALWKGINVAVKHLNAMHLGASKLKECFNEIMLMNTMNFPQIVR